MGKVKFFQFIIVAPVFFIALLYSLVTYGRKKHKKSLRN